MFRRMKQAQTQSEGQSSGQQTRGMKGNLPDNIHVSGIAVFVAMVIFVVSILAAIEMSALHVSDTWVGVEIVAAYLVAFYILFALKVARQWEKAVVLRMGKFQKLRGPGLFWIVPIVDTTPTWIDHRVMVTPFNVEKL